MIDQLVSGPPQPAAKTSSKDRQQPGEDGRDKAAEAFGDLVSRSHQQHRGVRDGGARAVDPEGENPVGTRAGSAARPALDLSLALRNLAGTSDGRVKLAGFKDALKAADVAVRKGDEAMLARLIDKLQVAAENEAGKSDGAARVLSDEPSPADELRLLLGLTSAGEAEDKVGDEPATVRRKADRDDKRAPDAPEAGEKGQVSRSDGPTTERIAALVPIEHRERATPDADKDAVRVVSADGRGRSVDVPLAKVTTEQTRDADKPGAASKVEAATVIEARRYLGFAQETNATTLAHAVKADPGWSAALRAAERVDIAMLGSTVTEVNTLKLQMNPENLGSMVASLRLKGEELTVELQVTSVEAYRHLSADQDDIVKALQDQGFSIDKVTVQLNAADRTDTGSDRDTSRQGQMEREGQGNQPDLNNGRGGNRSGSGLQQEAGANGADDGPAVVRHPGGVYL